MFVFALVVFLLPFVVLFLLLVLACLVFVVLVVVPVLPVRVAVAGQAVLVAQAAHGEASEAAFAHEGEADGAAAAVGVAAGQRAVGAFFLFVLLLVLVFVVIVVVVAFLVVAFFVLVLVHLLGRVGVVRFGEAGNVVVLGAALEGVQMPGEAAAAAVEAQGAVQSVAVVRAQQSEPAVGGLRHAVGDAPGLHVHHAADGAAAVEQGARPFQHFDALGQERLHRDGVIAAGDGYVHDVDAILHQAHAGSAHAVDHGAADGGAVVRVVDAGLAPDGGAHAGGDGAGQIVVREDRGGLRKPVLGQGMGGDHDLFDGRGVLVRGFGRAGRGCAGGQRRSGGEGGCDRKPAAAQGREMLH